MNRLQIVAETKAMRMQVRMMSVDIPENRMIWLATTMAMPSPSARR